MTTDTANPPTPPTAPTELRWRTLLCFLLMLAAIQLIMGPKIHLSQWNARADENAGVLEGVAWMQGRLDLPDQGPDPAHTRMHDTAYLDGKVYNVFPPLVGFLTVILAPLHRLMLDRADLWLQTPMVLLVFWPIPIAGFVVFRRQTGDAAWAALLTVGWMGGTALLPELSDAGRGQLAQMNHVLSQFGLLIVAADLLGRQRIWPALIGLTIAVWTRQMTCLYALPLLYVAWQRKRLLPCIAGLVVIAAPLLTLNYLKFGSPLDFGYRHIYVNRDGEPLAERCNAHGTFSPRFIPDNFYYMHLAPPEVQEITTTRVHVVAPNLHGVSIWITTPLLFFVLIDARRWLAAGASNEVGARIPQRAPPIRATHVSKWSPRDIVARARFLFRTYISENPFPHAFDPRRRLLMLATLPVMLGLLCYHGTGFIQPGWNRFALDFLPIWLAVIAPWTRGGWRTWFTLGCIAWSLLYFQTLTPNVALAPPV